MKRTVALVLALICLATVAHAGMLRGMRSYYLRMGSPRKEQWAAQTFRGVPSNVVQSIVTTWDEDLFVDSLIPLYRWETIRTPIGQGDQYGTNALAKIANAILSEMGSKTPNVPSWNYLNILTSNECSRLESWFSYMAKREEPDRPILAGIKVRSGLKGRWFPYAASEDDLISWMLANERMSAGEAIQAKSLVQNAATRLAKSRVKAAGGESGVISGMSPVAIALKPVVDALNSPMCEGIEVAILELGGTVPKSVDRDWPEKVLDAWMLKIVEGDDTLRDRVAGKIFVAMGAVEYNQFVMEYNGEGSREALKLRLRARMKK